MRGVTLAEPRYWLSSYRKSSATSELTSTPPRLRRFIISVDSVRPRPIMFSCCDARGPERINAQVKKARVRGSVRFTFERALPYLDRSHLVLLCTPERKSLDSLIWQASPYLEEERETVSPNSERQLMLLAPPPSVRWGTPLL